MRLFWILGLLLVVLGASVPQDKGSQERKFRGNVLTGRLLFVEKGCVRCHAVLGSGGDIGPDLAETSKGMSFFDLLSRLWSHSPRMVEALGDAGIEWPLLDEREMDDLLSYLYYLNYFDKPGDYSRGEKTFRQKGCVLCHTVGTQGGKIGPSLDPYGSQASPVALVAAMWNHGPNMALKMKELSVPKPELEGSDVADLLAYIRGATITSGVRREFVAPGDPARGRELFDEVGCIRCHAGSDAERSEGNGGFGPDLAESDLQRSVSELAGVMWNHGPIMWAQMKRMNLDIITFQPEDMAHIIAHLYFIHYYDESGDAAAGKEVFEAKKCAVCHPTGGAGEAIGPDLSMSRAIGQPARFAAALWNHAPAMLEKAEANILAWPEFRQHEMRDLHAHLVQLKASED